MINCECCSKLTENKKYCCISCSSSMPKNVRIMYSMNCKTCNKFIVTNRKVQQYCCGSCSGHNSGIISSMVNKRNRTAFYDPEIQSMGGKIGGLVNKRNKTGVCALTFEQHSRQGNNAVKTHKNNKTGFWNPIMQLEFDNIHKKNRTGVYNKKNREKGLMTQKKNKTGLYGLTFEQHSERGKKGNKTNQKNRTGIYGLTFEQKSIIGKKGGKIGGPKGVETLRKNSKHVWEGVNFRSKQEMECAKIILTKPILGVNCNISIGSKWIDFYPQKDDKMFQGYFVEYHPILNFFYPNETSESYFNSRRKVLDENGYKDVKLILIKNLKELDEIIIKI